MKTKQLLISNELHAILKLVAVSRDTTLFKMVEEVLRRYIDDRLKKTLKGKSFWSQTRVTQVESILKSELR